MSPDGLDPQEMVYGDTYKPRKRRKPAPRDTSNISNASIDEILDTIFGDGPPPPLIEPRTATEVAVNVQLRDTWRTLRAEVKQALTAYIQQECLKARRDLAQQIYNLDYEGDDWREVVNRELKDLNQGGEDEKR